MLYNYCNESRVLSTPNDNFDYLSDSILPLFQQTGDGGGVPAWAIILAVVVSLVLIVLLVFLFFYLKKRWEPLPYLSGDIFLLSFRISWRKKEQQKILAVLPLLHLAEFFVWSRTSCCLWQPQLSFWKNLANSLPT